MFTGSHPLFPLFDFHRAARATWPMLPSRRMGVTSPQNLQRVLHAPLLLLQGCRWPPSAALALSHLQKGGLGPLSSQSLQVGQIMKYNVRHQTLPLEMRQQGVATILEKGKGSSSHPFSTAHPQLKVMSLPGFKEFKSQGLKCAGGVI